MRGARVVGGQGIDDAGIIPAYAGSTLVIVGIVGNVWDHPRVCGEHGEDELKKPNGKGSSPRMRGAPNIHRMALCLGGIIPAYAGSTLRTAIIHATSRDHPRVCGEHDCSSGTSQRVTGSSPRMRGARITRIT